MLRKHRRTLTTGVTVFQLRRPQAILAWCCAEKNHANQSLLCCQVVIYRLWILKRFGTCRTSTQTSSAYQKCPLHPKHLLARNLDQCGCEVYVIKRLLLVHENCFFKTGLGSPDAFGRVQLQQLFQQDNGGVPLSQS